MESLDDDDNYPLDPLIKMVIAHYQFEAIHPFRDENGWTGRIICLLYLIQKPLLEELGLLSKSMIGKEFVWFNTELMDILSAEE